MRLFRRTFCWVLLGALSFVPTTSLKSREHRCRRRQLADDRPDRADAVRRGRAREHHGSRLPGGVECDQVGAVTYHPGPAPGDRLLEPRWRVALERNPGGTGCTL